jgi:hypothetical protein
MAGRENVYIGPLGDEGEDGTLIAAIEGNEVQKCVRVMDDGTKEEYEVLDIVLGQSQKGEVRTRTTLGVNKRPMIHVWAVVAKSPRDNSEFLSVWANRAAGAQIPQDIYDLAMDF